MKRYTFITYTLLAMAVLTTMPLYLSAQFAGGSGTEADPWQIETAEHLNNVRNYLGDNHADKYFIQTANIDLYDATREGGTYWNNGEGWVPIGINNEAFTGEYNGNNHTINGIYINRRSIDQSLFGIVDGASICDMGITNVNISGNSWVGGLVARSRNNTFINNCYTSGRIEGYSYVGGLLGTITNSTVQNSHSNTGVITRYTGHGGQNSIGGLVGSSSSSFISRCYSGGLITANWQSSVGGLVGTSTSSVITDSYSTVGVYGVRYVGGLVGTNNFNSSINNSYSKGVVRGVENIGGLVGRNENSTVTNSYWDRETSGRENSSGGTIRNTAGMTFPYSASTYVGWDFDEIWGEDVDSDKNNGYPFQKWRFCPMYASSPFPVNQALNVSISLEEVRWSYRERESFVNPLGFRIYFSDTGEFGEDDNFAWVPYIEGQGRYSSSNILPDSLNIRTKYYWKVIPTTRANGIEEGLDARDCPVWSFVTELNPIPLTAVNPCPAVDSVGVTLDLEELSWEYIIDTTRVNPQGFRVYFNNTGEFGEEDDFEWVSFIDNQQIYSNSDILPEQLQRGTIYYWQVIPTTRVNGIGEGEDALNCPVWTFISEPLLTPASAVNPYPADDSIGVSIDLFALDWDYVEDPRHLNPVGFRVYFDTDDEFGEEDFFWVPYIDEQVEYQCADILPERLARGTTYYWKVVPTTNEPDERREVVTERRSEVERERRIAESVGLRAWSGEQRAKGLESSRQTMYGQDSVLSLRNDAENCPVWQFTTEGQTDIEDSMISCPYVTRLDGNHPNPFNPETTISFSLAEAGKVTIAIYNLKGQKVKSILDEFMDKGNYHADWDGRDERNKPVGSGIYLYQMKTEDYTETRRMILLK